MKKVIQFYARRAGKSHVTSTTSFQDPVSVARERLNKTRQETLLRSVGPATTKLTGLSLSAYERYYYQLYIEEQAAIERGKLILLRSN